MGHLLHVIQHPRRDYSMFRRFTKKRSIVALSVVAVLALAAGAYAYFTSTGHDTQSSSVGSATSWTVVAPAESSNVFPRSTAALSAVALTGGSVTNASTSA